MKSITILRAELSRRYAAPDWLTLRRQCYAYYGWQCAVCGLDWQTTIHRASLQAHHTPEGYRHLWKEGIGRGHLVALCSRHHPKGRLTAYQIKGWRKAYRWQRRAERLSAWLWGLIRSGW